MSTRATRSTDEFNPWKFKPRGRVTFTRKERILLCEAVGSFDENLIEAIVAVQVPMISDLNLRGKWGDIVLLGDDVGATPQSLSMYSDYLRALVKRSVSPTASAIVFGDTPEGGELLAYRLAKCYKAAGLKATVFAHFDVAHVWVKCQLL